MEFIIKNGMQVALHYMNMEDFTVGTNLFTGEKNEWPIDGSFN